MKRPTFLRVAGPVAIVLLVLCPSLRAQVGNDNPTGPSGQFNGNITTGGSYDPYTGNVMRSITDLVVSGAVGQYGLSYTRTWNSRAAGGWAGNYGWKMDDVIDLPNGQVIPYTVSFPDGRVDTFGPPYVGGGYHASPGTRERLLPLVNNLCYLLLTDGGKVEFSAQTSSRYDAETGQTLYTYLFTPTALIDPYGQRTTLSFNADKTINRVTEPAGRYLQFNYGGSPKHLTSIAASNGQTVTYTFTYAAMVGATQPYNMLTKVSYFGVSTWDATYTYVKPNVGSANGFPLLKTCQDTMYSGPMKNITYAYATANNPDGRAAVYGQILSEKNTSDLTTVSTLTINSATKSTETRGDGATRTFTYSGGYLQSSTDFKGVSSSQTYDANGYVNSVTNLRGNTTNFINDPITGNVTQVTLPLTNSDSVRPTVKYVYGSASCPDVNNRDGNNPYYLYSVTNERGFTTVFLRDTSKRVTRINYPDGAYETFTYNSFGEVSTHRLTSGATITNNYGTAGLLLNWYPSATSSDSDPSAHPTVYTYDGNDRVWTVKDPRNKTTTYTYTARGQVKTVQHPDADLSTDTYTYSPDGTLLTHTAPISPGVTATTSYTYDEFKRIRTVTSPGNGNSPLPMTQFFYGLGDAGLDVYTWTDSNVTRTVLPSGHVIKNVYDENRRLSTATTGYGSGIAAATTTYTYDPNGNVLTTQTPRGDFWNYSYDSRNRPKYVIDPLVADRNASGHTVDYLYDPAGNKTSETRANDQVINYVSYDEMNRLTQMNVGQAPTATAITYYTWTQGGKIDTMTDPGNNIYNYNYDELNRLITTIYPSGGGTETRTYDSSSNLATFKNRGGAIQTFTYDGRNRETRYDWDDGVTPFRTLTYDDASRVTTCNTSATAITYTYFADGSLQSQAESTGYFGDNNVRTLSYTYNADGQRASVGLPGLIMFNYAYTARNQLDTVTQSGNGFVYADYDYDLNGNMISRKTLNNVTSTYGYDAVNRLNSITHPFTTGTETVNYGYDAAGNRRYAQPNGAATADGFGYDANSQLTSYRRNGTLSGGAVTGGTLTSFAMDASGNWTGAGGKTYGVNNLNQYTTISGGGAAPTYGAKGNLATNNGWVYTYDAMNRLTQASNATTNAYFYYDGLNRQIARSITNQPVLFSVWDGWDLYAEYAAGNAWHRTTIHGAPGDLVEKFEDQIPITLYYPDGIGSITHAADGGGALVEKYTYDAYGHASYSDAAGNPLSGSARGSDYLFTGQKWYPELGLYDNRNRFYFPDFGRFLQPDPIGFAGDPSNIYRYCGNNPANLSDPYGLFSLRSIWNKIIRVFSNNGTQPSSSSSSTSSSGNSNNSGTPADPGEAERIIVNGTPIETAATAGPYPVGPATPIDYAPNDHGSAGGNDGSGTREAGFDLGPTPYRPPIINIEPNPNHHDPIPPAKVGPPDPPNIPPFNVPGLQGLPYSDNPLDAFNFAHYYRGFGVYAPNDNPFFAAGG